MGSRICGRTVTLANPNNKSVRFLLNWINKEMVLNLKTLEELRTGAIYCQMMHKIFPQEISLAKVNFNSEIERTSNAHFNLLQKCLNKLLASNTISRSRDIPVTELVSGRGHLEFTRWFYMFYQEHVKFIEVSNCDDKVTPAREMPRKSNNFNVPEGTLKPQLNKRIENYLDLKKFCEECRNVPLPPSANKIEQSSDRKTYLKAKQNRINMILNSPIRTSAQLTEAKNKFNGL